VVGLDPGSGSVLVSHEMVPGALRWMVHIVPWRVVPVPGLVVFAPGAAPKRSIVTVASRRDVLDSSRLYESRLGDKMFRRGIRVFKKAYIGYLEVAGAHEECLGSK
jgi:hypothetical protein